MNALDMFYKVTGYNILEFDLKYKEFMAKDLGKLESYYKGNGAVDKGCFKRLFALVIEANNVENLFNSHSSNLSGSLEYWELLDSISDYITSLDTVVNLGKWMRSAYTVGFENNSKVHYILKQGEGLERLSVNLGSVSPNEDWVSIALDNMLTEEDYNLSGGNDLKVKNIDKNREYNIQTTVDFMVGENILGKDIDVFLQFVEDDVLSLTPIQTLEQTAKICLSTVKGSVPKFLNLGVTKSFIGTNLYTFRSGGLLREILQNFRTDDAFKTVELVDFLQEEDTVRYEFRIFSKLNDEINVTI